MDTLQERTQGFYMHIYKPHKYLKVFHINVSQYMVQQVKQ